MYALLKLFISYLLGSVNFAYVFGKLKGIDISKTYDRNLGAGNLYRATRNKPYALTAALLDVLKVFAAWQLAGPWGGVAAYFGHAFSIYHILMQKKLVSTGMGFSSLVIIFLLTDVRLFLAYLLLLLVHNIAVKKVISKEVRLFAHQLYHFVYVALAISAYLVLNPQLYLLAVEAIAASSFMLRWAKSIQSNVLPHIPKTLVKDLRKKEKLL